MIDKLGQMKDLYALKKQADDLKKQMEKITVEVSQGDYKLVMQGDQKVRAVFVDGEEDQDLKKLFNQGVKESQKVVSKKMRGQLGGLGLPGF